MQGLCRPCWPDNEKTALPGSQTGAANSRHTRTKRTPRARSAGSRRALTCGKESSRFSWKHGSTCANVRSSQVREVSDGLAGVILGLIHHDLCWSKPDSKRCSCRTCPLLGHKSSDCRLDVLVWSAPTCARVTRGAVEPRGVCTRVPVRVCARAQGIDIPRDAWLCMLAIHPVHSLLVTLTIVPPPQSRHISMDQHISACMHTHPATSHDFGHITTHQHVAACSSAGTDRDRSGRTGQATPGC